MSHFTELNLQEKSGKESPRHTQANNQHWPFDSIKRTAAVVGSLMIGSFVVALLLGVNGCSKTTKTSETAITAPSRPQPSVTSAPGATAPQPEQKAAAKKSKRQHKAATYTNAEYGLSFTYPQPYTLSKGNGANLEWPGLGPVEMNFVQPGGTTLAAIELPHSVYPDTNFASGFMNVSVNPLLGPAQCEQFAFPDEVGADGEALEPSRVKLAGTEFSAVESSGGDDSREANARYYHVFRNGMCYEFALGLETLRNVDTENTESIDHKAVFNRLQRILTTIKINPVENPELAVHTASAPTEATAKAQ